MAYTLPFTLKIKSIRPSPEAIEVDAVVADADGHDVRFIPIIMGPQNTVASVCAILQHHVNDLAQAMFKRGEATPQEESEDEEERVTAFEALIGKEFTGSVA